MKRRQRHLNLAFTLHTGDSVMKRTPRARTAPQGSHRRAVETREDKLLLSNVAAATVGKYTSPSRPVSQPDATHTLPRAAHQVEVLSASRPSSRPGSARLSRPVGEWGALSTRTTTIGGGSHRGLQMPPPRPHTAKLGRKRLDSDIKRELAELKRSLKSGRPESASRRMRVARRKAKKRHAEMQSATGPMSVRLMKLLKVDTNKHLKEHHRRMNEWLESKQLDTSRILTTDQVVQLRSVFNVLDTEHRNVITLANLKLLVICCGLDPKHALMIAAALVVKTQHSVHLETEGSDSRLAFLMKQDIGFADFLAILIEQIDVPTAFLHPTSKQSSPSSSSSSSFSSSFSLSHVYQRPVRGGVGKSRKVHTSAFSISTFILGQVSVFKWRLQSVQRGVVMRDNVQTLAATEPWRWSLPVGSPDLNGELEKELKSSERVRRPYVPGSWRTRTKHGWAHSAIFTGTFSTQDLDNDIEKVTITMQ